MTTELWLLLDHVNYEGDYPIGVYETEELAIAAADSDPSGRILLDQETGENDDPPVMKTRKSGEGWRTVTWSFRQLPSSYLKIRKIKLNERIDFDFL